MPLEDTSGVEIVTGPNIVPFPEVRAAPRTPLKPRSSWSWGTTSPPTTSCRPATRSSRSGATFRPSAGSSSSRLTPASRIGPWPPANGIVVGGEKLRAGIVAGTRGPGASLPGDQGQACQEFRPDPQGKPHQLRHPAATFREPGDYDLIRQGTSSASAVCGSLCRERKGDPLQRQRAGDDGAP